MIDHIVETSSIPIDAALPYPDIEAPPRRPSRSVRPVGYAYSWGEDVVVADPPSHDSDLPESRLAEPFSAAARRIAELLALPPGWDSYGASAIERHRAVAALSLIWLAIINGAPMPAIVPTSDGGIQLEWHRRGADLEIRVISGTLCEVYFEDLATNQTYEQEVGVDFALLKTFFDRVTGP